MKMVKRNELTKAAKIRLADEWQQVENDFAENDNSTRVVSVAHGHSDSETILIVTRNGELYRQVGGTWNPDNTVELNDVDNINI